EAVASREPGLRGDDMRLGDAQRRYRGVEIGLGPGAGLAQRGGAVIALLGIGKGGVVLVEVGLLQLVVDGIDRRADLDLVALADVEPGDAAGFVGADENHVGLDPALKAGIPAPVAAGQRGREPNHRHDAQHRSRPGHVVLRSPKIRSRWTRNISIASSGECVSNRLFQITATIAGATMICGNFASSERRISPRAMPTSIRARNPASPRDTTSR